MEDWGRRFSHPSVQLCLYVFLERVKTRCYRSREVQGFETIEIGNDFKSGSDRFEIRVWKTFIENVQCAFNTRLACPLFNALFKAAFNDAFVIEPTT